MNTVMIVEDEQRFRTDLIDFLNLCGLSAEGVGTIADFSRALSEGKRFDVVIVDIGLPDGSGLDLVRDIRADDQSGIILLTALSDSESSIQGYRNGADMYLVKDRTLREIEAAIRSLLRRTVPREPSMSTTSAVWALDSENWRLIAPNKQSLTLTATEFKLLKVLLENMGAVCPRDQLIGSISRPQVNFDDRYLDAVISRVRRKIDSQTETAVPIKVVYGIGYTFTGSALIQ